MAYLTFETLANKILKANTAFDTSDWPSTLYVPEKKTSGFFSASNIFWEKIKAMRKYTESSVKEFTKKVEYSGSTGWEYEMTIGYFHENFYYTDINTSKDYQLVKIGHSFKIDDHFNFEAQQCIDKVIIDDEIKDEINWPNTESLIKRKELIQTGSYRPIWIMNLHTHPLVQYPQYDKWIYTFFSETDMRSFLGSNMFMMGLVTDRLWVACKTHASSMPTYTDLKDVTMAEFNDSNSLESKAGEVMNKYGIVLYSARFGSSLKRTN